MKRIQPKTFIVMVKVLEKKTFSQRKIWRSSNEFTSISIGQVNKVINELIDRKFITRLSDLEMKYGLVKFDDLDLSNEKRKPRYQLRDPVGLLKYISMFRSMDDIRAFELFVDAKKERVMDELSELDVVFSLGTAMERSSSYFRSDRISFYANDPAEIFKNIKNAAPGDTHLICYSIDFMKNIEINNNNAYFEIDHNRRYTKDVLTVIDMFCDDKSAYTKTMLEKIWDVNI